ncbi:MAG: hypothetical protein JO227_08315 [Acetobacteraceae bacterium]|nr:hypothetical protein [Acetobacteraceae bacterium]
MSTEPETIPLLGLDFANMDAEAAARWIAARPADAPFGYVVTPNADHFVRLSRRPELMRVYQGAVLRLLDSRVVAGMARLLGLRAPAVATGSDVTVTLLMGHLAPGERVTIIGLRPSLLPALIARCHLGPPAHFDPPMGMERDPAAIATASALGSPCQKILPAADPLSHRIQMLAIEWRWGGFIAVIVVVEPI